MTQTAASPLSLAGATLAAPVVLAPMAGVTNIAYRSLCGEFAAQGLADGDDRVPGLFVSEMVTARALVERDRRTLAMVAFAPNEQVRSLQLYGVDPQTLGRAAAMVRDEGLADHIDLNFGCPVPKVTRKGGGSALPYKRTLFRKVVGAVVANAGELPVTVKMRKGLSDEHLTYLEAGRIAQDEGAYWVALHARTTLQYYSGHADWEAIARLKDALSIPVLGNGDIWEARDAVAMMAATGCDGVVVGRGCLGRPWLFRDLTAAFTGVEVPDHPRFAAVASTMQDHARRLVDAFGEHKGCQEIRKHIAWYLKGFSVAGPTRLALAHVSSLDELATLLAGVDQAQPFNTDILGSPRGRTNHAKRVALPDGWLDDPDEDVIPFAADVMHSGG
jgi:nifR3 family TIM-barrel protein